MSTWDQAQNILCVRLDTIGDILMTTPAIRALKESSSDRRITLLTSSAGVGVVPLVPEIDEVIVYDSPWLKATAPRRDSRPEFAMIEQLRQLQFDAAVIFTVYSQNPLPSAFLCYLADIPLRLAHCRENPYQLLTDWIKEWEPEHGVRHEVQRQLDLVASVGATVQDVRMQMRLPESAYLTVQQHLARLAIAPDQPWVVIHPGATAASRRYPPEKFAIVARQLIQLGYAVIFTGTAPERDLIQQIQSAAGVATHTLVGELNLAELSALIATAPLLISNNTGPVHIAAAVGTPVVDLYALTNPQHTPWQVPHRLLFHDVPCKYCYKSICPEGHHHCLDLVDPVVVVQAAQELLMETAPQRSRSLLSTPA